MAKTKYLERISLSKEKKDAAELEAIAEDAGIQLQADISAAKKAVRSAERELDGATGAVPFDSENYIIAKRSLVDSKQDLADLNELQNDLFAGE